jgi:DNA-binding PadR family transcriptional regulator
MEKTEKHVAPKLQENTPQKGQAPASWDPQRDASREGSNDNPSEPLKPQWFHILLSLADRELHGTAIMEEVLERTEGNIRLWPGTLYGALGDLADRDLIREVDPPEGAPTEGGKRRFYTITPRGKRVLAREVARLEEVLHLARSRGIGKDLSRA